ncbi:MAG: dihydropteroate synthase [Muribaculaceae bacterium]|nr:dihydropteroate synthase [Muribaculaceae bacterium]MDE6611189.1 dihydropteroate synthase [Muribaculaceae bacterium]
MKPFTLNIRGRVVGFDHPVVMGIINATPDSFYAGSRVSDAEAIADRARSMIADGADMLDVGAYSSRPGAADVSAEEEARRLEIALGAVRAAVGDEVPVSVDTFRADVARRCVREWGADIVNDISGGKLDSNMFATVADLRCPYILMHMRGTPATMQTMTDYADVTADVISELSRSLWQLAELGVADVIVDPGFGFAKTLEQNYEMMARLGAFDILDRPLLVGVSRKSMLTRLLGIDASDALVPTAVLGAYALDRGASILRVHDVLAARQSVTIFEQLQSVNH